MDVSLDILDGKNGFPCLYSSYNEQYEKCQVSQSVKFESVVIVLAPCTISNAMP